MGRISVCFKILACLGIATLANSQTQRQPQFIRRIRQGQGRSLPVSDILPRDIQPIQQQASFRAVPYIYGQGPSNANQNQKQYFPQQQMQQQPQLILTPAQPRPQLQSQVEWLQPQPSMLVPRMGQGTVPRSRTDDEVEEHPEEDDLSYSPSKKKKKSKKKDSESFPRRIFTKTTSAIRNTAGAVFGAPKYIYTRYRDSLGFGEKKKSQKKKSKAKGYQDEDDKGWGWEKSQYNAYDTGADHYQQSDKNNGWGWDGRSTVTEKNDYERKSALKSVPEEYKYKRYLYKQANTNDIENDEPEQEEQGRNENKTKAPLSSLTSWFG